MKLKIGDLAPEFKVEDSDGQLVDLSKLIGSKVVLYFYPKDNTPGCTLQAAEFSDHELEFGRCNCIILGVSRDDCLTHAEFRDKEGIGIELLSDALAELPDRCREVVYLRRMRGLSQMQVAAQLGISVRTVESQFVSSMPFDVP